jgi:DNA invertase Pin-like site-specific DNA recombinase
LREKKKFLKKRPPTMKTNKPAAPAVIYARFSSHAQNEQSIEGQLRACYDFAERQGYTVIGEYIDRALSGTNDNRPEFQRMIEDSSKRLFEIILVYQLDRFARNRYDSAVNKAKLKKNGVRVLSARENITDDASGILMEAVLEGMAEYYSAELSQKVRRGMDINAERFLSTGSNVGLGFRVDGDKRFQIDEQTAPVVVKIFEMYASGHTVAQICEHLNRQQIKTAFGVAFNKNSLRVLLQNRRYIGMYLYKGKETPGGMPRIVSDELFYRVQGIMEKNKKAPARARAKEEYILTTKLFCGHCREMMTGISGTSKTGAIYNYYTCNGRKRRQCKKKNVQKEYIEDLVVNMARAQLTDENISRIAAAVVEECEKEKENPNMRRLSGLLRDNEKAVNNLLNAIEQGQGVDLISKRLEQKQREKADIEKEIAAEAINRVELTAPEIRFFLTELRNGDINDAGTRRMLVTVLVNAVYLYDDRLTVVFNASGSPVEVAQSLVDDIEADAEKFFYDKDWPTKRKTPKVLRLQDSWGF